MHTVNMRHALCKGCTKSIGDMLCVSMLQSSSLEVMSEWINMAVASLVRSLLIEPILRRWYNIELLTVDLFSHAQC